MLQNSNNPQAMMQNLMAQNPQLQATLNFINQYGGKPEQLFYSMARQMGQNPEDILRKLRR